MVTKLSSLFIDTQENNRLNNSIYKRNHQNNNNVNKNNTTNNNNNNNNYNSMSNRITKPILKKGKNTAKLRPLSLPKLPRLSIGLPPFQIDGPPPSPSPPPGPNSPDPVYMNSPPRTNWNVSDTGLRPVPPFYPPLIPSNCTYISDASPSVVAARIAVCLTRRSLTAEYGDEDATATVFGVDTSSFGIRLYRGNKRGPLVPLTEAGGDPEPNGGPAVATTGTPAPRTARPDFSHGVIVEIARIRGDVISFHRDCRAVLS